MSAITVFFKMLDDEIKVAIPWLQ